MNLVPLLEDAINKHFEGTDQFLVHLTVSNTYDIDVTFDSDTKSSLQDCERLSRAIKTLLEEQGLEDYSLEVGTHGLGTPLKLWRQYEKFINRDVELHLYNGEVYTGILKHAEQNVALTLTRELSKTRIKKGEAPEITIPFSDIKHTKAVVKFK